MRMLIDLTGHSELQTFLSRLLLTLTSLAWCGLSVDAQEIPRRDEVHLLPQPNGEAFTLTPTDMPDVSCSIVEWKPVFVTHAKPTELFTTVAQHQRLIDVDLLLSHMRCAIMCVSHMGNQ